MGCRLGRLRDHILLLLEGLLEQPDNDGKVAALIVGGEENRVFVADSHFGGL